SQMPKHLHQQKFRLPTDEVDGERYTTDPDGDDMGDSK
ncbi:MAG: hypothetical protein ACI9E1_002466, partial [Cryomorphaceae bacterium]